MAGHRQAVAGRRAGGVAATPAGRPRDGPGGGGRAGAGFARLGAAAMAGRTAAGDARLGDDRGDQLGRRHVEGRVAARPRRPGAIRAAAERRSPRRRPASRSGSPEPSAASQVERAPWGRRRRTGPRGARRAPRAGRCPTLFAVSPFAAIRSAPTRTASTSPEARSQPAAASARSVYGIPAWPSSQAVSRAPCEPGARLVDVDVDRPPVRGQRPGRRRAPSRTGRTAAARCCSGSGSGVGRSAGPAGARRRGRASRAWSSVASPTIASASRAERRRDRRPVVDRARRSPRSGPACGRAPSARDCRRPRVARALAVPRRIARRAYGFAGRGRPAVSARPSAATWPSAGAPRTTISRIAWATSAPDSQSTSTSSSGSRRWSRRIEPRRHRGGTGVLRKPRRDGRPPAAPICRSARRARRETVAGPGSASRPRPSRGARAASAVVSRSAPAAPTSVAAALIASPANARKKRRRASRSPSSTSGPDRLRPRRRGRARSYRGLHGPLVAVASTGATGRPGSAGRPGQARQRGRGWSSGRRDGPTAGVRRSAQYWMTLVTAWSGQPVAALEEVELDEEGQARRSRPCSRSTSSIVPRTVPPVARRSSTMRTRWPGCDRVAVDLERVGAVLEGVLDADRLGRAACRACAPGRGPAPSW